MVVKESYVFDSGVLVEDIKKQLGYIIGALVGDHVDKETATPFHLHAFVDTTMLPSDHPNCDTPRIQGKRAISYFIFL